MTTVSSIMSREPVSAGDESGLSYVVALMAKHSLGSIYIVNTEGIPVGVVTERELLAEISTYARVRDSVSAKDIMSQSLLKISSDKDVLGAARLMFSAKKRLVVTRKNGKLEGIVTTTDFLRFFNFTSRDFSIDGVINKKVQTLEASRGVLDAIRLMNEKRIGSVIVTKNGLPYGIVTERDLVKILSRGRRKEFGSMTLEKVASQPLVSASYGATVKEASSIMLGRKIKRLAIFRGDVLFGIVTAEDLVRVYASNQTVKPENQRLKRVQLLTQKSD